MRQKIDGQILQDGVILDKKTNEWDWNWLPEIFRDYGKNTCELNKISHKMLGTTMIATACAAVGRNAYVTPNKNNKAWKLRCNLWGVCTAPAGSRKSDALSKANGPFFREQEKLQKDYVEDMEEWIQEELVYKNTKLFIEKQMKMNGGKLAKGMEFPKIRPKPKKKYYIATDMTAERIPSFIDNADGSASIMLDEMSSFFQSTSGNSSRGTGAEAKSMYLSAWSGDSNDVRLRQTDNLETSISGASISVFGMAQPDIIADHVADYKKAVMVSSQDFNWLHTKQNIKS